MNSEAQSNNEEFNSVWVGKQLLALSNACINSFIHHGYGFNLYTYNEVDNLPLLARRKNANDLISEHMVFLAHGGWETFTDQFAYSFLYHIGGWWVDNDVICNSSCLPNLEMVFAEEKVGTINNAVLKFPKKHPAIKRLLEYIRSVDAINAQWGATGPLALTKVVKELGLADKKCDSSEIYALHWREAPKMLFPEFTEEILQRIDRAPFLHLWGATLREVGFDCITQAPLKGSFLDILYDKHLDAHIMQTLVPLDEARFRRGVKTYIREKWLEDLAILA